MIRRESACNVALNHLAGWAEGLAAPEQERLYAWLGGLRASDACEGLLVKLASSGLASQQRAKLEALRVRGLI